MDSTTIINRVSDSIASLDRIIQGCLYDIAIDQCDYIFQQILSYSHLTDDVACLQQLVMLESHVEAILDGLLDGSILSPQ